MHGEGRYKWPDGRVYEGQYVRDFKEGEGSFFWADGRRFVGQWKEGLQDGYGIIRNLRGNKWTGEWCDGIWLGWIDPDGCEMLDSEEARQLESLSPITWTREDDSNRIGPLRAGCACQV
eukprot:gnl/TRDRNA2_/TRDRNA2_149124_c0_seq1.p1 gnl/TRDRNA2_/TRDRNA2_149124_c0~~gnl/TRDRNA2_/TRDRNA2_149124_c0_seq1.p1  ORF type:complete len:119 (+),score=13.23 gnl/TRDRNA2_/TRDRNA2_149124_c0_seq1:97-453(+)